MLPEEAKKQLKLLEQASTKFQENAQLYFGRNTDLYQVKIKYRDLLKDKLDDYETKFNNYLHQLQKKKTEME